MADADAELAGAVHAARAALHAAVGAAVKAGIRVEMTVETGNYGTDTHRWAPFTWRPMPGT